MRRVDRAELFERCLHVLGYVVEMGHPATPQEVREFLATKGIVRRVEAVRNALIRLEGDGALIRTLDKRFAVPSINGDGAKVESGGPLSGTELDMPGAITPDG